MLILKTQLIKPKPLKFFLSSSGIQTFSSESSKLKEPIILNSLLLNLKHKKWSFFKQNSSILTESLTRKQTTLSQLTQTMALSFSFKLLVVILLQSVMAMCVSVPPLKKEVRKIVAEVEEDLSFTHYARTCPNFEAVVHNKVKSWIAKDYTLAASLIRLHFHDCAVRGCDASVLLNHKGSERSAKTIKTLRGFQVIDDIKSELEKKCPKTVSCADILTAVARDASVKIGGPFWENSYGRKDGKISLAKEAELVPMGYENVTHLIEFFQSKGLNILDLVVLSGAHTIGRSQCAVIQNRIYNFKNTGKPDPTIDHKYLDFLRRKCRWASEFVEFDASTPYKFDSMYYKNLEKKMGLLSTDQLLYSDSRTAPIVQALASQPMLFYQQFAVSMVNMANAEVIVGDDDDGGEIRRNCNHVNH